IALVAFHFSNNLLHTVLRNSFLLTYHEEKPLIANCASTRSLKPLPSRQSIKVLASYY
ncbi:hypothetical protein LINPERHAP2_LOCUS22880, partial [Linum perenne]